MNDAVDAMDRLEIKIAQKIHEFDIISLLRLLHEIGYQPEEVRFAAHNSICSQNRLLHGISFRDKPVREVVVTLNLGLLSAQSPLPSYFRRKIDADESGGQSFIDFVGYFDHHLIRDYICNLYPELNRYFFPSWELTKNRFLQILDLQSLSSLHWLFQLVFPELQVKAGKATLQRQVETTPVQLGKTAIGSDATLGCRAQWPIQGRRMTLYADEETTAKGVPWAREIGKRLENLLLPLLGSTDIELEVDLVLRCQKRWVQLHPESFLGYDQIRSKQDGFRQICIFHGHVFEQDRDREQTDNRPISIGQMSR